MNGEAPTILSINYHSMDGDMERFAVTLNLPELSGSIGPPLQEVYLADRQAIKDRVRELMEALSRGMVRRQ